LYVHFKNLILLNRYFQLCFAYKASIQISLFTIQIAIGGGGTSLKLGNNYVNLIPDNTWHYTCLDMYQIALKYYSRTTSTLPINDIVVMGVNFWF
jgi:hypothetical protein